MRWTSAVDSCRSFFFFCASCTRCKGSTLRFWQRSLSSTTRLCFCEILHTELKLNCKSSPALQTQPGEAIKSSCESCFIVRIIYKCWDKSFSWVFISLSRIVEVDKDAFKGLKWSNPHEESSTKSLEFPQNDIHIGLILLDVYILN